MAGPVRSSGLFLLLLLCGLSLPSLSGLLVPPFSLIPLVWDWPYRIALSTVFFVLSRISLRLDNYRKFSKVFFSFFIGSIALNLQALSAFFNFQSSPVDNIALSLLSSTCLVIVSIVGLTLLSGDSLSSIFLSKGRLKLGLSVGSIGFIAFALGAIPTATYLFQGQNLTEGRAIGWAAPLLVTVIANGFREELLYRGLFLKRFDSLLGSRFSNLLQAIIFSLSHTVAGRGTSSYTPFIPVLVGFTLALGLVWGLLMQKTNGVIGSVLFHAGSDIPVFLGIFSNLT